MLVQVIGAFVAVIAAICTPGITENPLVVNAIKKDTAMLVTNIFTLYLLLNSMGDRRFCSGDSGFYYFWRI